MSNIDDKIREALKSSGSNDELLKERGMMAEVLAPFRGKRRWVNYAGIAYGLVANVLFFWASYRMYVAEEAGDKLNWLLLAGIAVLFVAFSKVYFWMEMHTNRVLREVKRVELLLLSKLERDDD